MTITNKNEIKRIKRLFFLVSIVIALCILFLFLKYDTIHAFIGIGVFTAWYLVFHVADFQFIDYSDEDNKITLKFYPAVRFGANKYSSIEFPQALLIKARFENSLFGKLSDLTLEVKTRRGIAEYPSISLTALKQNDRQQIQESLNKILGK